MFLQLTRVKSPGSKRVERDEAGNIVRAVDEGNGSAQRLASR